MIVLNLQCSAQHCFEGWFSSAEALDEQIRCHMVTCPVCSTANVSRLPSAPRVLRHAEEAVPVKVEEPTFEQLARTLADLMASSEDVAERFPEEARRIHYGEASSRNIRGQASLTETRELIEEGIAVLPLPLPTKGEIH